MSLFVCFLKNGIAHCHLVKRIGLAVLLQAKLLFSSLFFFNQAAITSFKEQCGLPTVTKLKECIQTLATRLQSPEGTMGATMVLKSDYPYLEPIANLSESTRKVITAYETVSETNDPSSVDRAASGRLLLCLAF